MTPAHAVCGDGREPVIGDVSPRRGWQQAAGCFQIMSEPTDNHLASDDLSALRIRIKELERDLAAARELVRQRTAWWLTHCDGETRLTSQLGSLLVALDEAQQRIVELAKRNADLEAECRILSREVAEGAAAMLGDEV
jgi:hypothetical protein